MWLASWSFSSQSRFPTQISRSTRVFRNPLDPFESPQNGQKAVDSKQGSNLVSLSHQRTTPGTLGICCSTWYILQPPYPLRLHSVTSCWPKPNSTGLQAGRRPLSWWMEGGEVLPLMTWMDEEIKTSTGSIVPGESKGVAAQWGALIMLQKHKKGLGGGVGGVLGRLPLAFMKRKTASEQVRGGTVQACGPAAAARPPPLFFNFFFFFAHSLCIVAGSAPFTLMSVWKPRRSGHFAAEQSFSAQSSLKAETGFTAAFFGFRLPGKDHTPWFWRP